MKNLFILAFVLSGTFVFGANSNENNLTELGKVEVNCEKHHTLPPGHFRGTIVIGDCAIAYDVYADLNWNGVNISQGIIVMGPGCDSPGIHVIGLWTLTVDGFITELEISCEECEGIEVINSPEFSEALRADLNRQLSEQ